MPRAERLSGPCSTCDACGDRASALVWSITDSIAFRTCNRAHCITAAAHELNDPDVAFHDEPRLLRMAELVCGVRL